VLCFAGVGSQNGSGRIELDRGVFSVLLSAEDRVNATNEVVSRSHELAPCIRAQESTVLPDGTRNSTHFTLASYFAYLNMHYSEIVARLKAIDSRNPIRDPNDIEKAAEFGCRHPSSPPCDSVLRRYCRKNGCKLADQKQLPAG